jgi:DNA-binding phage protein
MTPEKLDVARRMYDSKEHTVEAIAATVGVSRKTIYRHLSARGLSPFTVITRNHPSSRSELLSGI